jgi:D-beta-D-heptose 7-phosphate kinase/D-beta-D-heptose 1-phosphate adenosyltransferase
MDIQQLKPYKILLIGDDCVDVYQYGTVDRISPEAPVPVFKFVYEEQKPGMAGNVCKNLEALDCDVVYLHGNASVKTRLIDLRSKQHIVRIDNDVESTPISFETAVPAYDAIVISDYNKGTVSYELIEELRQEFNGPIFVDTKKTDLARLEGCIVKINSLEHSLIKTQCTDLIITMGKHGARYKDQVYAAEPVEVADVCGAGDTFLAALVSEYLTQCSIEQAIPYAIRAAGITVQHLGVYAPTWKEIE